MLVQDNEFISELLQKIKIFAFSTVMPSW